MSNMTDPYEEAWRQISMETYGREKYPHCAEIIRRYGVEGFLIFEGGFRMRPGGSTAPVRNHWEAYKARVRRICRENGIYKGRFQDALESLQNSRTVNKLGLIPLSDAEEPFFLGKYQVTQKQWEKVMGSNPSFCKGANLPVESVSQNDARDFCWKLTAVERAAGRLPEGYRYTLPTEKQWEYACRAGSTGEYGLLANGREGKLDEMGWYYRNSGWETHPVGQKKPNAWGFYDMHGNVWEWCWDWYQKDRNYCVLRGGSRFDYADKCRSAYRGRFSPYHRNYLNGFRLALSP